MTYDEFLSLEVNDSVVYDGVATTVTNVTNYVRGKIYYLQGFKFKAMHSMRQLELTHYDRQEEKLIRRYPIIYFDVETGESHNNDVLARLVKLRPWDEIEVCL